MLVICLLAAVTEQWVYYHECTCTDISVYYVLVFMLSIFTAVAYVIYTVQMVVIETSWELNSYMLYFLLPWHKILQFPCLHIGGKSSLFMSNGSVSEKLYSCALNIQFPTLKWIIIILEWKYVVAIATGMTIVSYWSHLFIWSQESRCE